MPTVTITKEAALYLALNNFVEFYVDFINSGDCGKWEPEDDKIVIEARKALNEFILVEATNEKGSSKGIIENQ